VQLRRVRRALQDPSGSGVHHLGALLPSNLELDRAFGQSKEGLVSKIVKWIRELNQRIIIIIIVIEAAIVIVIVIGVVPIPSFGDRAGFSLFDSVNMLIKIKKNDSLVC
jgi:hypothetical protein